MPCIKVGIRKQIRISDCRLKHIKNVDGNALAALEYYKTDVITSGVQIKLADKQAALEKSEWEAREATNNNMKLQEKLDSIDLEISSFMHLFMELSKTEPGPQFDDDITYFNNLGQLPILDVDENAMEEARVAYVNALAAAKENPSEETLAIASEARMRLQSFVL